MKDTFAAFDQTLNLIITHHWARPPLRRRSALKMKRTMRIHRDRNAVETGRLENVIAIVRGAHLQFTRPRKRKKYKRKMHEKELFDKLKVSCVTFLPCT